MELYKAEAEQLKKQINNWLLKPDYELESTFGKGSVDATTFFQVALRLRSKGLRELSQEDRLTITTPEHIRFTIQSMGVITQYCNDNTLAGKPFVAMIKDRVTTDSSVDFDEYDVRVKTRREILIANDEARINDMFSKWPQQQKAFRMIRRWSFEEKDGGIRYDLSIVRSTSRNSKGDFKWQRKFLDQDLSSHPYLYEIEVELLRKIGDTEEIAQKRLIKGIGEVLRGIQKNSILIRKSTKEKIIQSYQNFIKSNSFLGCSPITLEQENFTDMIEDKVANIRNGYNVTDKADGLRCLAYTDSKGFLYLIDNSLNVYRTGLEQPTCRESIIDGEWVTRTSNKEQMNNYLAFDIYYTTDKKNVSQYPFYNKESEQESRHYQLKTWIETFNKGDGPKRLAYLNAETTLKVSMKTFLFAKANDLSIFKMAAKVLDTYRIYYTDGLIFTPNNLPLPGYDAEKDTIKPMETFSSQFKWKPSEDNTIDFLVRFEKMQDNKNRDRITSGIKPVTNETISYKTMRLFVGSNKHKSYNPRDTLLNERVLEEPKGYKDYRPVPFYPVDYLDSMASVCYGEIKIDNATQEEYIATEHNNEPIQDKSIVEMRYDTSMPDGWKWIPLRIRHDKTERYQKGILARTLNGEKNANSVWNSIHNPVTESMIRSGSTQQNEKEIKSTMNKIEERENVANRYFDRNKAAEKDLSFVQGMREFHNHYIKELVLYAACLRGGKKTLIDIACGTGSDIRRWNNAKVSFVLGIDYASDNITNTKNGAYAQYANHKERNRRAEIAPMVFVIGDSSKRLIDGKAGSSEEERDILRSVFGKYSPIGPIPPFIDRNAAGNFKNGTNAMACMFALHYFFKNKQTLDGLIRNIRESVKLGGYFFGCCFDGDSVFKLLKNTPNEGTMTGLENETILWNIRKMYDVEELVPNEDSLGLTINVNFISIGSPHDEYLVSFPYFVTLMKDAGMELLSESELKEINLKYSTNLFSESYEMSKKIGKNYIMSDAVKQFSFLNRWFIFRKKKDIVIEEGTNEEDIVIVKNNGSKNNNKNNNTSNNTIKPLPLPLPPINSVDDEVTNTTKVTNTTEVTTVTEKENDVMPIIKQLSQMPEAVAKKEEERLEESIKNISKAVTRERTVPVEKGSAAPQDKLYASNEVLNFYMDAALDDKKLSIGDKGAMRWLAPCAPFPIKDMEDKSIDYPSIEHFMAAMMYKYGTKVPQLAQSIFSENGSIHQAFTRRRLLETQALKKPIPEDKDFALIKEESKAVKAETSAGAFKRYKAVYDESKYIVEKDKLLRYAVEQRYKTDARLRKILEAARIKAKYLLYFTRESASNIGGERKANGKIDGDNKLGKLYMEFAGYSSY